MIKKLTEREHIIQRPTMYIGAVDLTKSNEYILNENDKIEYKEIAYVPGLIKIINEIIDNCVDVAIKTDFKFSNEISIKIDANEVSVQDNGTGIPVKKNTDGHYLPELCWNHARAGSNFDDDKNRTQIGMNGVGSYATACFSKEFVGLTDDGENRYKIVIKDNASSFTEKLMPSKQKGTTVTFIPDLEKFGLKQIDDIHINVIKQRLINLSLTFPKITFKFNSKKININSFKKYVSLFNETFELYETEDYKFAILPNESDDFKQFSYVNGLKIPDGGSHIDYLMNNVVTPIREKLIKKYKSIKPADIKNKLMVIAFLKNLSNTKFNSQTKEKITNSASEISSYYGNIDFEKITNKILKTSEIIDPITEVYKIKEELKKRQELKGLDKGTKKVKSDKYIPSIGEKKFLFIVEGDSAAGGLIPSIGRQNCGYYMLKGKPLNSYDSDQSKFTGNKELSELYKIAKNEGYEYLIAATDQDLDGIHIRALLCGFIDRYLPEYKNKFGFLNTPVIVVKKNKEIKRWYYNLSDEIVIKPGEVSKYMKGLGSHNSSDLKMIIEKEGLDEMIYLVEFDDDVVLDDWLSSSKADKRKEYIILNEFSIAKV